MAPFGIDIPSIGDLKARAVSSMATAQAAATAQTDAQTDATKASAAASSSWRSKLKAPSFRGVPFQVETDDEEGGRRAAAHEFPGSDVPFTEDLGKKAGVYTVEAYVLGKNYMAARDALIKACNAEGPGALIVPWMPERQVICTGMRKRESAKEGGKASFSLTFTEAGKISAPKGAALPGVLGETKADEAIKAVGKVLDSKVVIAGVPVAVGESTLATLKELGETISGAADVARLGADLPGALKTLQNITASDLTGLLPSELTGPFFALSSAYSALTSAYASSSSTSSSSSTASSDLAARATGLLAIAAATPTVTTPVGAGTVRTTIAANQAAIAEYQRSAAVAEAARSVILVSPASKQEASTLRTQVVEAIDTVLDTSTDAEVYATFTDLRTTTVRALAESSGKAPEVTTVTTTAVLPALLLGQRLVVAPGYGTDATTAEAQILARNKVRHPGFVPQGELEVLRAL